MNAPLPAARAITDVKVDRTPAGATGMPRITINWIDGAGEPQEIERYALAAELIITDLHAATLLGEDRRQAYLIGFIRCHSLHRRGPD
jgi:hypothetical protein